MKKTTSTLAFLALFSASKAQTEFFKSDQAFETSELHKFYSSLTYRDSILLFSASDYKLYAYNTNTLRPIWNKDMQWKSDVPPHFVGNTVWASGNNETMQLNLATGEMIRPLPLSRLETAPFSNNGIYFGTGIYDGGCLFAYDPVKDSMLWTRFLAHGCAVRPTYLPDRIIANAEADNWLEIGYDGKLIDTNCEDSLVRFPSELSCIRKYVVRTHDGKELTGNFAKEMIDGYDFEPQTTFTANHTLILNQDILYVIGNKLKKQQRIELTSLVEPLERESKTQSRILKADDKIVWLLYLDRIVVYDYIRKKTERVIDLASWHPHQGLLDGNRLWLISRENGLLYGLTI